jgi:hypothetical protein
MNGTRHCVQTRFSCPFSGVGSGMPRTKMADNSEWVTIFVRKYIYLRDILSNQCHLDRPTN